MSIEAQHNNQIQEKTVSKDTLKAIEKGRQFAQDQDMAEALGLRKENELGLLQVFCGIKFLDYRIAIDADFLRQFDNYKCILPLVALTRKRLEKSKLAREQLERGVDSITKNLYKDNLAKPRTIQFAVNMLVAALDVKDRGDSVPEDFFDRWAKEWRMKIADTEIPKDNPHRRSHAYRPRPIFPHR